ncbi:SIS domain-containing protein [Bradyrhizobium manausense]|uniref:SIS domain-containing protein n=1 Tax=Bradyrhizobium manausense TaxID=989370 RepID=UPI001BAC639D|nr:SIS domain-containing protein [Bradyrhizobium manausense]MBR1092276.1 SIS domain-containing protein [Bradyrhizobium manausense]
MTRYARDYFAKLKATIDLMDFAEIDNCVGVIERAWREGRQILTLGNGGSAMTAIHYITDWSKMISNQNDKPFYGRTLLDNIGMLTAYANDVSYADIFSEQLKHTATKGDVVIAISGSGNSENVVRAVRLANAMGCETIGLCGFNGGQLRQLAKHTIWVDIDDMQICEDLHAIFGHIVMQRLCGGITDTMPGCRRSLSGASTEAK